MLQKYTIFLTRANITLKNLVVSKTPYRLHDNNKVLTLKLQNYGGFTEHPGSHLHHSRTTSDARFRFSNNL